MEFRILTAETWAAQAVVVRTDTKGAESQVFHPTLGNVASKTQVAHRKSA